MKAFIPVFLAIALAPLAALADGAAAAAPTDSLAPPSCTKPSVGGAKIRAADDDSALQERVDKYKTCIEAYASAQSELAQQHQKASNDAIAAFNDFIKEVNDHNMK